jgi:hypothetical protein
MTLHRQGDAVSAAIPQACRQGCGGPAPTCAYCSCRRARPCETCPVRCCWRLDAGDWLADVGGTLDLDGIPWPKAALPRLPALIPVVGPVRPLPPWPAYAVRWSQVLGRGGASVQARWLRGAPQAALGAAPDAAVVAALVGPDPAIERFWTHQFRGGLYAKVAAAGFDLVVGPNYSVYGDQPRFEHRLNVKRSILAAARLRAAGAPAVPHLYVWRRDDAEAVGEWARVVGLDAAAVNWQTFRTPAAWEAALARYADLRDRMPPGVRWFFVGVSSPGRVRALRGLFPRCHVLTAKPYEAAAHGRRLRDDGREDPWPARPAELLAENLAVAAAWCEP